jgi:peptide/nickel transport system substrate-binding protein
MNSQRITRRLRLLIGVLTVTLIAAACGSDNEPSADGAATTTIGATDSTVGTEGAAPESIERLRLAGGDFGYPSPFGWVRGPGLIQAGYIFDTLVWQDSTGEFIPWLASDWSASDDATEWTFTLHPDAIWHDGTPLTARDVVFTYDYVTSGAGADAAGSAFAGLQSVSSVTANGDGQVVFELNEPSVAFIEDVADSMLIIPEHIWSAIDNPREARGPEATIGSGPYQLESADPGTGAYSYTAFEDFYLGSPVVKRLEFVPVNDELVAVQAGEISAGEVGTEQPVPEAQMDAFADNPALGMIQKPGDWNLALHFNLAAGFPYDDVRFRRALAYGIDRQGLVDRILFGRGVPGSLGGLAPSHPFTTAGLPTYAHDVVEAERLLDDLGMVDADGDGIRDLPDGSAFNPTLKASQRFSADTPQLIREYLLEIGIDVNVEILDRATADEAGVTGDYTLQLHGYGGIAADPDSLRQRFSDQENSRSFNRAWGYENAEFDALAAQQLVTLDTSERMDIVAQMEEILAADVPVLSIYVPDRILFYDEATFDNWYYTPGCSPCRGSRNKHMFVTGRTTGFAS